jgi:hypothetical protein
LTEMVVLIALPLPAARWLAPNCGLNGTDPARTA